MSLVEQAARRLEQLRKAGAQVSGELSYALSEVPADQIDAAPSTIERAVQRLDILDRRQTGSEGTQAPVLPRDKPSPHMDDLLDRAHPVRREPKLGESPEELGTPDSSPLVDDDWRRDVRELDLDLRWLSSAGYLTPDHRESEIANEFRRIKRPLINACQGKTGARVENPNRIMVTSSLEGEGKSFVSLNLAISIAMERNCTALLIDADTTRPSLSHLLGLSSGPGLLDLLTDHSLPISKALARTNIERLMVLPAGAHRPHATELLASEIMEGLVQQLASRYPDRILIFDTPPLLAAPEPAVLARYMGQILVVVEANRTTHKALQHALAAIESRPVVMTMLNKSLSAEQTYQYGG